jgi:Ca2+-binding RTX toxin-like protein
VATRFVFGTLGADNLTLPDGHDPSLNYDVIAQGFGGDDTITGGTGNDWIWGSTTDAPIINQTGGRYNIFSGGAGDDVLVSYGAVGTVLDGGAGNDILILGSSPPFSASGIVKLEGGAGDDQLWATGGAILTTEGSITITQLGGGAGNDTLVGGGFLYGEDGNDLLIVGNTALGGGTASEAVGPGSRLGLTVNVAYEGFGGSGNDTLYAATGVQHVSLVRRRIVQR